MTTVGSDTGEGGTAGEGGPADAAAMLHAGDFSSWLGEIDAALDGTGESDVPCDGCTACCTSSQFIHIAPDETDALAHIPKALRFPAPGLPEGHVLMGYDEHGACPMLIDNRCSIYVHRPRTCRTYDCRVFPAAGLEPEGEDKALIAQRVRRWRFDVASVDAQRQHEAVRGASRFIDSHRNELAGEVPPTTTQLAVLAVELRGTFLSEDRAAVVADPDIETVRVEIRRIRARPAG